MARIESDDLEPHVVDVLRHAATGKGTTHGFMTAYQILHRLPQKVQDRLADEYGQSGKRGGQPFGPASRVAQVAADIPGVSKEYLDTAGLQFDVGQADDVEAGYNLCALFQLPRAKL